MHASLEFRHEGYSPHPLYLQHDPISACRQQLSGVIEILGAGKHLRQDTVIAAAADELLQTISRNPCPLPESLFPKATDPYRRLRLWHDAAQGYEVLALLWPPGACSPVHDHRGAWGIEAVWAGQLEVTEFSAVETVGSAVRLKVDNSRAIGPGQLVQMLPPNDIHLCRNPWARGFAISINIYSTELTGLTVYEAAEQGWYIPHCRPFPEAAVQ